MKSEELINQAQFYVVDPAADPQTDVGNLALVPLEMPLEVSEMMGGEHGHPHVHEHSGPVDLSPMEVKEPGEVAIVIDDIPGAPHGSKDPELEVQEEPLKVEDQNDAGAPKKDPKWDWEAHGPAGFIAWVKSRCDDVPKHSGQDSAGLERAMAYLDKLDGEISRAMRMDLDGQLDANQVEKVRAMIDEGIARLHDRLDKVKKVKKTKRTKKKTSEIVNEEMIKEAQKIMGVGGVFAVADLLTLRIAKVCINGMVSAGHDIEDLYERQIKEYGLNKREQACVRELLENMGYALREDRLYSPDEDVDIASSDNGDWAANYKG
jgi:hypothetical protein